MAREPRTSAAARIVDVATLHAEKGISYHPGRLIIDGGKIVAAGRPDQGEVAAATQKLSGSGRRVSHDSYPSGTALPGLIDTHVHLTLGTGLRTYEEVMTDDTDELMLLRAADNAHRHLRTGVTTVRDLGARGRTTLHLRQAALQGILAPMPGLQVCGRSITAPGGHFWFCGEQAADEADVRASVNRLVAEGVDVIKIMATGGGTAGTDRSRAYYSATELQAAVEVAHAAGLRVVAHAQGTPGIRNAISARVDGIEHCDFLDQTEQPAFEQQLAEQLAVAGTFVSPTLQVLRTSTELLTKAAATGSLSAADQKRLDSFKTRYEAGLVGTARLWSMGVRLVGGSDAIRGFGDYHLTFETFRECGLPAAEALAAVTAEAAQAMGIASTVGRLRPGLLADVLVLGSDPLVSDEALRQVIQVYRLGQPVLPNNHDRGAKSPAID